eukprot:c5822_g1_i1.p1 GENE.c5822_g1_i1~~c5822_g1_i1.p1  ORF type:complete len:135 (+),score=39.33 c5822_g1_i1:42-407(+)
MFSLKKLICVFIFVSLITFVISSSVVRGKIESCPGCKLNRLHELRKFIKESGQADSYENLEIEFIRGHNPDLVLFNEQGEALERIDLTPFNNEQLHSLLQSKGFVKKPTQENVEEVQKNDL